MGKHSRKENKGKDYWLWRSKAVGTTTVTRQLKRAAARIRCWFEMSHDRAPTDDHGIIPRRVRRDMALTVAKRKTSVEPV